MTGLTKRQQMVLNLIQWSIQDHGYPPTVREMCNSMGYRSTNSISDVLAVLERKGFLERNQGDGRRGKSRAIKVINNQRIERDAILHRWAYLAFLTYKAPSSNLLPPGFDSDLDAAADAYETAFYSQIPNEVKQ